MKENTAYSLNNGVTLINLEHLWAQVKSIPAKNRLKELMKAGGVQFFQDTDCPYQFISKPSVGIVGIGGIPVDQLPLDNIHNSLKRMMGYSASMSYLNPQNLESGKMFELVAERGEFSVAHTCMINMIILGLSVAAEAELNTQRDVIHLSRVTIARTAAQDNPPIVVLYPEALPATKQVYSAIQQTLSALEKPSHIAKQDWRETINTLYPAAKATAVMVSGSVRNLQKLMSSIDDNGKEEEYRRILSQMNDSLSALFPEMFHQNHQFNHPPKHYAKP